MGIHQREKNGLVNLKDSGLKHGDGEVIRMKGVLSGGEGRAQRRKHNSGRHLAPFDARPVFSSMTLND